MQNKIGYLGPQGTFSEMAMLEYCKGKQLEPIAFATITDAVLAVHEGLVAETVVPVENALEGSVNTTLDLLAHEADLLIKQELVIPIRNCLLTLREGNLANIEVIYSHPQPIGQCMQFIRRHMSNAAIYFTSSTAEGAQKATENPKAAAIGTKRAAELCGLKVVAEGIEDREHNCTRFVVLSKADHPPTDHDKTSLIITVPDTPGSLYAMLGEFAQRGINLQKIESRPSKQVLGEYIFFIDVNGHRLEPSLYEAIGNMQAKSYKVKVLGSYPRWRG
jgi:prephenate dehydratase